MPVYSPHTRGDPKPIRKEATKVAGENEDTDVSVMRETILLVLELAKQCKTLEQFIGALEDWLKK